MNVANMVEKKNGAVVFVGLALILLACFLGVSAGTEIINEVTGANDRAERASAHLDDALGFGGRRYAETVESLDNALAGAMIGAAIAVVSLIAGIILFRLKSHFCSACGAKVGIKTARLCGACGSTFVGRPGSPSGMNTPPPLPPS